MQDTINIFSKAKAMQTIRIVHVSLARGGHPSCASREYDCFAGSAWSLPQHGAVAPPDGLSEPRRVDQGREALRSVGASCLSRGEDIVDALGRGRKNKSTSFRIRHRQMVRLFLVGISGDSVGVM